MTIEYINKTTTMDHLMTYFDQDKVNNDCIKCPNYNRIWSCPPHEFDVKSFLRDFKSVELKLAKMHTKPEMTKEEVLVLFDKVRRQFSDELIAEEDEESLALIAGNCYQCEICARSEGKACLLKGRMRYSLESLGFKVGEVAAFCGVELKWSSGKPSPYLVTVGALLKK